MVINIYRVGKGCVLLLVLGLVFSLIFPNFLFGQQPCTQYQARIWVDKGCDSTYSEGERIEVFYEIDELAVSCEGNTGGPFPADASMSYVITEPLDTLLANFTIIDYYVTQGTQKTLDQGTCYVDERYSFNTTVDCVSGLRKLEFQAEINIGGNMIHLKADCYFTVTGSTGQCSRGQCDLNIWSPICDTSIRKGDSFTVSFEVLCEIVTYYYYSVNYHSSQGYPEVITSDKYCLTNVLYNQDFTISDQAAEGMKCLEFTVDIPETGQTLSKQCCFQVISNDMGNASNSSSGQDSSSGSSGGGSDPVSACYDSDGDGYSTCAGDCNDNDATIHPGTEDICDGIDNNCNGASDEDCQSSAITLAVSPQSSVLGDPVSVSGSISPSRSASIILSFTKSDGEIFTQQVASTADGIFSYSFEPNSPGTWSVTASVEGTSTYRATISETVSFYVKNNTHILLQVTPTLLFVEEHIVISGSISPARVTDVVLTIGDGEGHTYEQVISTSSNGTFSLSYEPDYPGTWYVSAFVEGNTEYAPSSSEQISFNVRKINTSISLNVSSTLLYPQAEIIIEGRITPALSTSITIILSDDAGNSLEEEVPTSSDGRFLLSYRPDKTGIWSVSARFNGDLKYGSFQSNTIFFTVEKGKSSINLNISDIKIVEGSPVEITGLIRPKRPALISIYLESDKGERLSLQVQSKEDGTFSYVFIPESIGKWSLYAYVPQDTRYTEAESNLIFFNVSLAAPDLAVSNLAIDHLSVKQGETIKVHFGIENLGTRAASNVFVQVSVNSEVGKTTIYEAIIAEIEVKDIESINMEWTALFGVDTLIIEIDPLNYILELNEENNRIAQEIAILRTDVTAEKTPPPIAETGTLIAVAASATAYWYWRKTGHSISQRGKHASRRVSQRNPRVSDKSLRQGTRVPTGAEPAQALASYPDSSSYYPYICKAKDFLLKAGVTSAANEIGAKLYKTLYNRNYHWNKAQPVDFERTVQYKLDLLEKVIAHLYVFEGYSDTEEFCRFFNTDEVELLEVLDFLYTNGYIERINT
jgi:hypothetical protein